MCTELTVGVLLCDSESESSYSACLALLLNGILSHFFVFLASPSFLQISVCNWFSVRDDSGGTPKHSVIQSLTSRTFNSSWNSLTPEYRFGLCSAVNVCCPVSRLCLYVSRLVKTLAFSDLKGYCRSAHYKFLHHHMLIKRSIPEVWWPWSCELIRSLLWSRAQSGRRSAWISFQIHQLQSK